MSLWQLVVLSALAEDYDKRHPDDEPDDPDAPSALGFLVMLACVTIPIVLAAFWYVGIL